MREWLDGPKYRVCLVDDVYSDAEQLAHPGRYAQSSSLGSTRWYDNSKRVRLVISLQRHPTQNLSVHGVDIQARGRRSALRFDVHSLSFALRDEIAEVDLTGHGPPTGQQVPLESRNNAPLITSHDATVSMTSLEHQPPARPNFRRVTSRDAEAMVPRRLVKHRREAPVRAARPRYEDRLLVTAADLPRSSA
jgi:hypothetical protein